MKEKAQKYCIMTYPRDMSTGSISTMCPAVTAESPISFRASSSLHVVAKRSPVASKSYRGYRDFKILRVRLVDCFMFARIISRDLDGKLSNI
jgi:hypothetical protein